MVFPVPIKYNSTAWAQKIAYPAYQESCFLKLKNVSPNLNVSYVPSVKTLVKTTIIFWHGLL